MPSFLKPVFSRILCEALFFVSVLAWIRCRSFERNM